MCNSSATKVDYLGAAALRAAATLRGSLRSTSRLRREFSPAAQAHPSASLAHALAIK